MASRQFPSLSNENGVGKGDANCVLAHPLIENYIAERVVASQLGDATN